MQFEERKNLSYIIGGGEIKQKHLPMEALPDGWVRLKVTDRGICGTDIKKILVKMPFNPIVLGHEFVGIVVEETNGQGLIGETVIGMPLLPCEQCERCKCGDINLCQRGLAIGRTHPGAFAEYVALPSSCCFRLPKKVSNKMGVLADVIAVALHAINLIPKVEKQRCLIIGDGTVGYALACLLNLSMAQVTMVGKDKQKATKFDVVLNRFISVDNKEELKCGYDIVFETVGRQQNESLQLAINTVKPKGTVVVLGVFADGFQNEIVFRDLLIKESTIVGSNAYTRLEFQEAILQLKKHTSLFDLLITHTFQFSDLKKGFSQMIHKPDPTLKVVISNG